MRLVASYRKETHTAEVIEGEDGKLRFRLADGREFTSPSAAAPRSWDGIACNGWRFWSLSTDEAEGEAAAAKQRAPRRRERKKAKPEPEARSETRSRRRQPAEHGRARSR